MHKIQNSIKSGDAKGARKYYGDAEKLSEEVAVHINEMKNIVNRFNGDENIFK